MMRCVNPGNGDEKHEEPTPKIGVGSSHERSARRGELDGHGALASDPDHVDASATTAVSASANLGLDLHNI
jgi:hypothetical protein